MNRADRETHRLAELLKALEAIAAGNIGGIAARTPQDVIQAYREVARSAIARDARVAAKGRPT